MKKEYELLEGVPKRDFTRLKREFEQRLSTAKIRIPCFTGGAISNNTAESVNARLRVAGLKKAPSLWLNVFQVYTVVTNDSSVRAEDTRKFVGSEEFNACLDEQCLTRVNAAVLRRVQTQFERKKPNFKLSLLPGSQWTDGTVHIQEDRELSDGTTTYQFQSQYTVTWKAQVSCTCHMDV